VTQLPAGWRLEAFDSLGSTSDEARRLARVGAAHGTVVWANEQTAGRGRSGRSWASPRGNLYASILLRPERPMPELAPLSLLGGLAVAEALDRWLGTDRVRLKWPNDALIDGRKIAGVLVETDREPGRENPFAVLGCGVNLVHAPAGTSLPATCLAELGGAARPEDVLPVLIDRLGVWLAAWQAEGLSPVLMAWQARAFGLGEPLVLHLGGAKHRGRFVGLDETGGLVLEQADGSRRSFAVGEPDFRVRAA
jgi:BirA family biotin operon repressor/biotin-[acetyl-CoA-carboxylase] ligase